EPAVGRPRGGGLASPGAAGPTLAAGGGRTGELGAARPCGTPPLWLGAAAVRAHLLLHHDSRAGALCLDQRRAAAGRLSPDHAAPGGAGVGPCGAAAARPVVLA